MSDTPTNHDTKAEDQPVGELTRGQLIQLLWVAAREGLGAGWDGRTEHAWEGFRAAADRIVCQVMPPAPTNAPTLDIPAYLTTAEHVVTVAFDEGAFMVGTRRTPSAVSVAYHVAKPEYRDDVVAQLLTLKTRDRVPDVNPDRPVRDVATWVARFSTAADV